MKLLTLKAILALGLKANTIKKCRPDYELLAQDIDSEDNICLSIGFVNDWTLRVYVGVNLKIRACYLYDEDWQSIADTIDGQDAATYLVEKFEHLFPRELSPSLLIKTISDHIESLDSK